MAQVLEELVQSGKIQEDEAVQILQAIQQQEGGGAGPEGGAPAGPEGGAPAGGGEPDGDEMPPGAAPEAPEEKQASEFVRSLIGK